MGKDQGNQWGKKRKKENLGKIKLLTVLNHKKLVIKTQFNTIYTLTTLFHYFFWEKIIDIKTQLDASRGRKSKAQ